MKSIFILMLMWGATAYSSESINAPGKIFYKMKDNNIIKREAVLQVPARGEGNVYLKSGRISIEAERFFSKQQSGRTVFYVVFDQFPGQQNSDKAIYRGTYTRGSNMAIYYGDVFIVSTRLTDDDDDLHYELSNLEEKTYNSTYAAGFYFKVDI